MSDRLIVEIYFPCTYFGIKDFSSTTDYRKGSKKRWLHKKNKALINICLTFFAKCFEAL